MEIISPFNRRAPWRILCGIIFLGLVGSGATATPARLSTTTPTSQATDSAPVVTHPTLVPVTAAAVGPSSTSAKYGDWVLNCQKLDGGTQTKHVCEVVQQMRAQEQQNPMAALAIGRLTKTGPLMLTVVLPVNVAFPNVPNLLTGAKGSDTVVLDWQKCLPGGCFADVALQDDVLARWKSETTADGRLSWKDAGGRDLAISVSSNGLSQALEALIKAE